ncbi:MAG TPA: HNH endonuclease signature motif containing protein, partial [Candidatus Lustribacter sp.]|nr:HNH endonuclease signature motif containing protein [Candidatus Lustribacter sp.]
QGFGPIPADLARDLLTGRDDIASTTDDGADANRDAASGAHTPPTEKPDPDAPGPRPRTRLRRLFASTDRRRLVAMESARRTFPRSLAELIALRDQTCRTPYCDAPIRHTDHVVPAARGGPTSEHNGQGLCEQCNYVKALPGWSARTEQPPGGRHQVILTTPTGHTYTSTAPPPLGHGAIPRDESPLERRLRLLLAA